MTRHFETDRRRALARQVCEVEGHVVRPPRAPMDPIGHNTPRGMIDCYRCRRPLSPADDSSLLDGYWPRAPEVSEC